MAQRRAPQPKDRSSRPATAAKATRQRPGARRSAPQSAQQEPLGNERGTKGQRTRAALVAAARKVFERDGFPNARITDIAAAAGLAHGTFYTYFDSKEAVFREVIVGVRDQLIAFTGEYPSTPDPEIASQIERAYTHYLSTYRDNAPLIRQWTAVAMLDPEVESLFLDARQLHVARMERTIRMLQLHGLADPAIDSRGAAHALVGMLAHFAPAWFADGDSRELEEGARQLARLWINAVGVASEGVGTPGEGR